MTNAMLQSWSRLKTADTNADLVHRLEGQCGGGELTLQRQSSFSLLLQLFCQLLYFLQQSFLTLPQ